MTKLEQQVMSIYEDEVDVTDYSIEILSEKQRKARTEKSNAILRTFGVTVPESVYMTVLEAIRQVLEAHREEMKILGEKL